jgi:hypothetical protein
MSNKKERVKQLLEEQRQKKAAQMAAEIVRPSKPTLVETPGSTKPGMSEEEVEIAEAPVKKGRKPKNTDGLPPLPKTPIAKRTKKAKPPQSCSCGCGGQTRGGRFIPGHDSRLHAWALRVERAVIKISEVPEMHRDAVKKLLKAGDGKAVKQALAKV